MITRQDTGLLASTRPLLEAMRNLTESHHEHEKYYSVAPREEAVVLQRHARTLHALADRWRTTPPPRTGAMSPYEGATDINADVATQLDGVLFLEDGTEPGEITRLKRDLRTSASDAAAGGEWLGNAMTASWAVASSLLAIDGIEDLLGERHRIITNNWQAAAAMTIAGRMLDRAADILDLVEFVASAVRADLTGEGRYTGRLYSAAELIDHAADLLCDLQ